MSGPASVSTEGSLRLLARRLTRLTLLGLHVGCGLALGLCLMTASRLGSRRPWMDASRSWWFRRTCRILRVDCEVAGGEFARPALVVSNHVSWLDILVLGGHLPVAFVSKAEVRSWPILGWMVASGGTVFIARGNHQADRVARELITRLEGGGAIVVFPEGTTTDGSRLRPFFPRLFKAAVEAQRPIQPIALRYGDPPGPHPVAPWIDDETFPSHLWRLTAWKRLTARLTVLPAFAAAGRDRRGLAVEARQAIHDVLFPPAEDLQDAPDRGSGRPG